MSKRYEFQFNNDIASCIALQCMIVEGWTVQGYKLDNGYTWFILYFEGKH